MERYQSAKIVQQGGMLPKEKCQKESACDFGHPSECLHQKKTKVDVNRGIRVYSSTQAKLVMTKVVMPLLPSKRTWKDGQGDTFSTRSILKKIGWPSSKKQFIVRCCRNAGKRDTFFKTKLLQKPSSGQESAMKKES